MPRPKLDPTPQQRRLVKSMAAMGTPQEHIARKIGIRSPKTLRKHFRAELETGFCDANYQVNKTLYEMATSGTCPPATIFWIKTRNPEPRKIDFRPAVPPPLFQVICESPGASS